MDEFTGHKESCTCRWCVSVYGFLGGAMMLTILLCLFGCASQHKPIHREPPKHDTVWELVPGHPDLHYGPERLQCDGFNHCQRVRDWLDKDGKPVLAKPCWFSRLFDWVSKCELKRP